MAKVSKRRGRYVVDYRDLDRVRRWESFTTRQAADKRLEEVLQGVRHKTFVAPVDVPTFEAAAKEWLETKADRKTSTLAGWQTHVDLHLVPRLGKLRLDGIGVAAIERVRDQLRKSGLGPRTVNKILTTATAIFAMAKRRGYIATNPGEDAERLRAETAASAEAPSETPATEGLVEVTEADVLTAAQTKTLLEHAVPGRDRALLMTLAMTGTRIGEATALIWPDIDLDEARVHIRRTVSWAKLRGAKGAPQPRFSPPKTKKALRTIPLSAPLVAELRRWKLACPPTANDLVFPAASGHPLGRSAANRDVLKPALKRARLPARITIHSLRHAFATALLSQRTPVNEVSGLLGHATPAITMRIYAHWLGDTGSASVDRLAESLVGSN
jgi:integrase